MHALDASLTAMDVREFKTFRELIHRQTGIWLRDGKHRDLDTRCVEDGEGGGIGFSEPAPAAVSARWLASGGRCFRH